MTVLTIVAKKIKWIVTGSIRRQLVFGIAIVHAVLMTVFVYDLVSRQTTFLQLQTVALAQNLAESLAANSSSWVLASDVVGLEELVHSQRNYPSLRYAMIHNLNGKILGYSDSSKVGKFIGDTTSRQLLSKGSETVLLLNNQSLIDVAVPITAGSSQIGWARVGIDRQIISDNLALISRDGIVYTLIAIAIGTIFAFFMSQKLSTGIDRLVSTAKSVSKGQSSARTNYSSEDEIGFLAKEFDEMLEILNKTKDEVIASEHRFKNLFDNSEVSIWNEDFSEVKSGLNKLRIEGILDLRLYLTNNMTVAWELASKVNVLAVNETTLRLFGTNSESDFFARIDKTFSEDTILVFIDQLCAIWERKDNFHAEATYRAFNGRIFSAIISFRIPKTDKDYKSIPISIIDISDIKVLEYQLRRSQKMEAVGQLTGGIAHDFNNILGIIIGNLEFLEEMLPENKQAMKRVKLTFKAADRGAALTRKLLNFSRKEAPETSLVSVNEFIKNLNELIVKSLTVAITVETHLADDLWPVTINKGDFEDVILNLSLNARDAMPEGGRLDIETSNKVLEPDFVKINSETRTGDYVLLSISDTGLGMSAEVKEKVLEPFFTTKADGQGTGLGLSMVYGFVQRSGGFMTIFSEQDVGTSIRIYLPRAKDGGKVDTVQLVKDVLPRGCEKVLVVDDEVDLAGLAVGKLEALGYKTLTAINVNDALIIINDNEDIDLLFSDIIMPGGSDGFQLAIEAQKLRPEIKVLLTSGFNKNQDNYAKSNISNSTKLTKHLLRKPYNQTDLAVAVRTALDEETIS